MAPAAPASSSCSPPAGARRPTARGLVAVFPTGQRYRITENGRLSTKWADFNLSDEIEEAETPPADDVGFVDQMLADIEAGLAVDPHRVYASGFSNGANFAARLAVDRSETFAAVAFSGGGLAEAHTPARRVPTYSTVGSLDDRILARMDPPIAELPLGPVQILRNPVLREYLGIALDTLDLDENRYSVIAEPELDQLPLARHRPAVPVLRDQGPRPPLSAGRGGGVRRVLRAAPAAVGVGGSPRWSGAATRHRLRSTGSVWGKNNRGPGWRRGGQPPRRQLYACARLYLSLVGVRWITP